MVNNKLTKHKSKKNNKTLKRSNSKVAHKLKGGGSSGKSVKQNFIYLTENISTQPNADINYKEIGVVHITDSGAVNALKGFATGIANIFGSKGFDNSVYDRARNSALNKLMNQIDKNKQKVCNLRMDVENNPQSSLFFIHLYGTLLEKK
jgi:hypothetical protein